MFVHPKSKSNTRISAPHVWPIEDNQIQPNAVDLRVDKIYQQRGFFALTKAHTEHRDKKELNPDWDSSNDISLFKLVPGAYEVTFLETVKMADDELGWVTQRSSLLRNGLTLTSGLYDAGYEGQVGGLLVVRGFEAYIERHTRLAQFLVAKADTYKKYEGQYGAGSKHDEIYQ